MTAVDLLLVLLGVPAASAVVAGLALRRVNISPLGTTRRVTPKPPRLFRFIPLGAGIAVLMYFVAFGAPESGTGQAVAYLSGMLLVMAGLVVAGPWLTMAAAGAMARRATRPASLIAARRLADNPQAGFRATSGLVLALFVTTAAICTITTFVDYRGAPTTETDATGTLVKDFTTFTASGQPQFIPSVSASTLARAARDPRCRGRGGRPRGSERAHRWPSARTRLVCGCGKHTGPRAAAQPGQETASTSAGWGYKSWRDASRSVRASAPVSVTQLAALPVQSLIVTAYGSPEAIERGENASRAGVPSTRRTRDAGRHQCLPAPAQCAVPAAR